MFSAEREPTSSKQLSRDHWLVRPHHNFRVQYMYMYIHNQCVKTDTHSLTKQTDGGFQKSTLNHCGALHEAKYTCVYPWPGTWWRWWWDGAGLECPPQTPSRQLASHWSPASPCPCESGFFVSVGVSCRKKRTAWI